MGRKIKGKKHRTVRYPEQQKRLRELKLYHKVNNPPKVLDDQEIPKGVRKIKEFKEKAHILEEKYARKQQEKKNKKLKKKAQEAQLKSEKSDLLKRFLVQESTEETIVINDVRPVKKTKPADITREHLTKFTVAPPSTKITKAQNNREEQARQVKQQKLLRELSNEYPSMNIKSTDPRDEKIKRSAKKNVNPNKRLNKREKDKMKHKLKQKEKDEERDLSAPVYDKVQFGEIVHAPPKFSKRPRNTQVESKPGKKSQNLLLASILNPGLKPTQPAPRKFDYTPDLTGKRKALSVADRRRLDKEQASAIAAYKKLKADKWKASQGK
ncbi:coiled-coil domain-containing protein 137-like isoform X1 [Diaphorina citri]|uniref:Coiled-coil domain-containing protein 137-like isoform X1 n=1 Tax=Diaphorina citri TaxID=121845 RepID=A0A1S4E6E4_DIACI|nr:coiled-coil domain-containing protein 137-like isoform X1 [Diaphorina citri]